MGFKASRYNYFLQAEDGFILAYNFYSNNLARITTGDYETVKRILEDADHFTPGTSEEQKLKADLIRGCFLIDGIIDERELLKMKNRMGRFSTDSLALTIAPTLACNFKCHYCFEGRRNDTMNQEVQDGVIQFVERRIPYVKSLHVSWFGGEPTLCMDIMKKLVERFKSLCEEHDVKFPGMSIITNGYLLNRENALLLKELNITQVQVTIDGPENIHDQRRQLKNSEGTFAKIIQNIKEVKDILNIYIRINIDRDNMEQVEDLYEVLKVEGLFGQVPFYFGQVVANTEACADVSTSCLSVKEHSELVVKLLEKSREKGFLSVQYPNMLHFGYCMADKRTGFVIDPRGLLFKCWCEIGLDESVSIGTIFDRGSSSVQVMNTAKYLNWDPFSQEDCLECSYLPICAGGCPYNAMRSPGKKNCTNFIYHLDEMLLLKYDEIKKQKKSNPKN